MITFLIVAHNEADTVRHVVAEAMAAAKPGDRVIVVDSASTDATADFARQAGAQVLPAPLGKGAAMEAGIAATNTEWVCFLDADGTYAENNIPRLLVESVRRYTAKHIIGDFHDGLGAVLAATEGFYEPLVDALFPEVAGAFGSSP